MQSFQTFPEGTIKFFSSLWLALFKEVNFAMILVFFFFFFYSPASNIQCLPGITAISKKTDFKCVKFPKE